jgi:hypothetical protein
MTGVRYAGRNFAYGDCPDRQVGSISPREDAAALCVLLLVNDLYAWKPTLLLAKLLKRVLRTRVWAHQAAWVDISARA